MSKNEKYPQIVLGTDNVYQVLIAPDVEVNFDSKESVEDFCKDKNFTIKGEYIPPKQDRKRISEKELFKTFTQF